MGDLGVPHPMLRSVKPLPPLGPGFRVSKPIGGTGFSTILLDAKMGKIPTRSVNLAQPHARPIVRGKAGVPGSTG